MNDGKILIAVPFVLAIVVFANILYSNKLDHEFRIAQLECSK